MTLFSSAEDAIRAGWQIIKAIDDYNVHRKLEGYDPISIGFGANTGTVMLVKIL